MYYGYPAYNMVPETPPGLQGLLYTAGGVVAPMIGGVAHPYVPVNQSTHDAWMARYQFDPLYKLAASRYSGQVGGQMANTAGALPIIDSLSSMSGYPVADMRRDMVGAMRNFGRSAVGSALMPLADAAMNGIGLSGGSFIGSFNSVYGNRYSLIAPGQLYNPYNREQQVSAISATSATLNLLNGLMSQQNSDHSISVLPDLAFTQGLPREQVTQLLMLAARNGAFNRYVKGKDGVPGHMAGLYERYTEAAGGFPVEGLDFGSGDFTGGPNSKLAKHKEIAERVKGVTQDVADTSKSLIDVIGSMRDMLKTTDGLVEKITAMTDGSWMRSRSGMVAAKNAVLKLNSVMMAYNLNPGEAWNGMVNNRYIMQQAAGFDENMQSLGFSGGGLFGLEAQTEFLAGVEDMIRSRGLQNDPIKSAAIKNQAAQAMAHNINSQAGRAAQVLAYARQNGYVTEDDAETYRNRLLSGDRASMSDAYDRLLTTVFGSGKRGRELMNDSMFRNSLLQGLTGESGAYAMRIMRTGAESEFMQREQITAAQDRLAFSKGMLARAGMNVGQTAEGTDQAVNSIVASLMAIRDKDGKPIQSAQDAAGSFREMYDDMRGQGMSQQVAIQSAMSAFRSNPVTREWSEIAERAVTRQYADNNDNLLKQFGGRAGTQAKALADAMFRAKSITGEQYADIMEMLRNNNGEMALSELNHINGGLSPAMRRVNEQLIATVGNDFDKSMDAASRKLSVEKMLFDAHSRGYGSDSLKQSIAQAVEATRTYVKSQRGEGDIADFQDSMEKSGLLQKIGAKDYSEYVNGILGENGDGSGVTDEQIFNTMSAMGKKMADLSQVSTKNLQENSYRGGLENYWLGGKYAGNDQAAYAAQQSVIAGLSNSIDESRVRDAKDRSTVAQNFYKVMADKDPKKLLAIYDPDGKGIRSSGAEYFRLFQKYTEKQKSFDESTGSIDNAISAMLSANKYAEVDEFNKYLSSPDSVDVEKMEDILRSAEIDGDTIDNAVAAIKTKKEMVEAKQAAEGKAEELAADPNGQFAYDLSVLSDKMRSDEVTKKKYADSLKGISSIDVSTISESTFDRVFGGGWNAASRGYAIAKDVVSDEDILARTGKHSIDDLTEADQRRTRITLTAEKAINGDKDARKAMEQFKIQRDEGVTKIRGEITIKNGNEQAPALLECVSETNGL